MNDNAKRKFPLQQGDVDWLCSVYALINLRSLGCPGLTVDQAWKDFFRMLRAIERHQDGDLLLSITMGIDPDDVAWLSSKYDGPRVERCGNKLRDIQRALDNGADGVIVFIEGDADFSHYTVVDKVEGNCLSLFDSFGYDTIEEDRLLPKDARKDKIGNVRISAAFRAAD